MSITLRHLTDDELIAAVASLAEAERGATAVLVAHLAELEARDLHRAMGFRSLYAYCRGVLHLSEHESDLRMEAARAARPFPVVLQLLAEGRLHLTAIGLLAPRLKDEDHLALLGGAIHKSKAEVETSLARWFPRPDVKTSIRRARAGPGPANWAGSSSAAPTPGNRNTGAPTSAASPTEPDADETRPDEVTGAAAASDGDDSGPVLTSPAPAAVTAPSPRRRRGAITPSSEDSFDVRFRARGATISRLRRAQELLSHAVPDGDIDEIVYRALGELIAQAEKKRPAGRTRDRRTGGRRARGVAPASRDVAADVQREVWARDGGQCAFVAKPGIAARSGAFWSSIT